MRAEKRSALRAGVIAVIVPVLVVLATGLLLAGFHPGPGCCSAAAFASSQDFDVERVIAAWVAMWNSYDLSQVDNLFVTDDRVTYFSSEKEGLIRGIDALRKHHSDFGFVPGGKKQDNKLWVDNLHSQIVGEAAIVAGTWYFQRAKNPDLVQRGPFTFVCLKDGAGYRIAHGHFSNAPEPKNPD
jgi:ketosteroid isomerase-like protein